MSETKTIEELKQELLAARAALEVLNQKSTEPAKETGVKKNKSHERSKPKQGRKYVLLAKELKNWGKVPQQQADVAKLLANYLDVDVEYTEKEVFETIEEHAGEFNSLAISTMDPVYVFRYYRGLGNDQKYGGFVARDFLRQIN